MITSNAPEAFHHVVVVRALAERGEPLGRAEHESEDDHRARIETALMGLFRDTGGKAEFEALYAHTRSLVLGWILAASRGAGVGADPLDFLQDTFVNIYRYASTFRVDHPRSFRGWARTIACNVVRRSLMRGRRLEVLCDDGQMVDGQPTPDHAVAGAEEQACLARAWVIVLAKYAEAYQRLCERDRVALDLVEVQGLSYAQASRVLGVGMSNMKMIMFRSRGRIRLAIQESLQRDRSRLGAAALRRGA